VVEAQREIRSLPESRKVTREGSPLGQIGTRQGDIGAPCVAFGSMQSSNPSGLKSLERETSVGLTQDHEWSGIRLVLTA